MSDYDLLILFSGGSDSILMLEFAKIMGKKPYCLCIDYEQLHSKELNKAYKYLQDSKVHYHTVSLKNLKVNSGLTGDGNKNKTGEVHEMYVPGRNTIFLSIAFSVAENKDIGTIWHGADWSDRLNLFPDCYQEYFVALNKMLKYAGPKEIKVEAPLLGLSKENILELLSHMDVDTSKMFSGYGDL